MGKVYEVAILLHEHGADGDRFVGTTPLKRPIGACAWLYHPRDALARPAFQLVGSLDREEIPLPLLGVVEIHQLGELLPIARGHELIAVGNRLAGERVERDVLAFGIRTWLRRPGLHGTTQELGARLG